MKRVMILGQPGAGKSTLAREIGRRTGLPVVHVDRLHWLPGWVERPRAEKIALALAEQARPEWIFEGGLSATYEDRFARADTVIFIDLPLGLRVWRVLKRSALQYGRTRPDMQDNCPERFSFEFYKWIWDTRVTGRMKPLDLLAREAPGKRLIHLSSRKAVRAWLAALDEGGQSGPSPAHDRSKDRTAQPSG